VSQVVKGLDNFLLIEGGWTRVTAPSYPTEPGDVQKAYDRMTFDDDRRRVMQEWAGYVDNCIPGRK